MPHGPIGSSSHASASPRGVRLARPLAAFVALALAAASAAVPPPHPRLTGLPFLSTWGQEVYGAAPTNYRVVQHPQTGFIYVCNNSGLLEFDGATWRLLTLPNRSVVPIVVVDASGTVWVGGTNSVAVLRPDARGELHPVDITHRLPAAERATLGRLYLGTAAADGVYFASPTRLVFFGHDGSARTWPAVTVHFNGLCSLDGTLLVSKGHEGLFQLKDGALAAVAPPPRSPNPAVRDTLKLFDARRRPGTAEVLLLTDLGPMRWAGPGRAMAPLSTAASATFARESASAAAFLRDGGLAFTFTKAGVHILDAEGTPLSNFTPELGLPRGAIAHVAPDNEGGLWLAHVNRITRLQLESRFAIQAALDSARAFLRRGSRLYIAHFAGVVWRDDATGALHPIAGFPSGPSDLVAVGDRIFATGQYLREITGDDRAEIALPLQFNHLSALPGHPGAFVGAGVRGVRLLGFNGTTWRDDGLMPDVPASVESVTPGRDGFLWATGYFGAGSWRLDFRVGPSLNAPVRYLDATCGLPPLRGGDMRAFGLLGEEPIAVREGRVLRYDRATERFVPEDRIDNLPALESVNATDGDDGDQWWFVSSPTPRIVHIARTAPNRWRAEALPSGPLLGRTGSEIYYDSPTRTLWIGGREPPVTVDPTWRPTAPSAPLRAVIRTLATASGEMLFGGGAPQGQTGASDRALRLDATRNSLRVEFSAPAFTPDFRGVIRTVYRSRLEGVESGWSPWSPTPWREFTDLPYRHFVFHVQARDVEGRESTVGTLAFSIAPPWWLARPAFAGYAVLALLALGGLFRFRTRALRRRNDQLEFLVAARTAELERLRRLEMDEKISARLAEEKARLEVLRYQLNPHFLFNSLNSIYTLVWSHSRPAGELVRRLAEFCRMTLTRGGAETATLAEEFTMLRAYLGLEQVRWQENLQVEFDLAPELEPVRLPPFLLLPLVENAVKYGGHTSPDLLRLRIAARPAPTAGTIRIEVANTGTWLEPGSAPEVASTGIGLENLRQRLARHYPQSHRFTLEADAGWVIARLEIAPAQPPGPPTATAGGPPAP